MRYLTIFLGVVSLASITSFILAAFRVQNQLSPQGCRMSWMSPSYILQPEFNASWTPLAHRYSLWLYREVGWESNEIHGHQPVLFIPGNAGSSHQVRSIASSAVRQFYASPHRTSPEFQNRSLRPIDMFAVDFNEDLSAFHGPTIDAQIQFSSNAIAYILSRYPPKTSIIILGHSMGGIVATSLLPSEHIAAVITMSTPHTLPPARFDQRVDRIYDGNKAILENDPTPVISLCGGATDMMIPSESCMLERSDAPYRRTVFSSALEGAWTGVGHREMVWCHQVRWRIARVALELQDVDVDNVVTLDQWLRDGTRLPAMGKENSVIRLPDGQYTVLSAKQRLVLERPRGESVHLLPITSEGARFTLYVSGGAISSVSPHKPLSLEVSVSLCSSSGNEIDCRPLLPSTLRLIPSPIPGKPFPVPKEGSDESEGVVLFEADVQSGEGKWVAVQLVRAEGAGWVVGGVEAAHTVVNSVGAFGLVFGAITVALAKDDLLHWTLDFPNLSNNALIVYRAIPAADTACQDNFLSPLLLHTSSSSEVHYFSLNDQRSNEILLHTHSNGPFVSSTGPDQGIRVDLLSTVCPLDKIHLEIAWIPTLGRWSSRYFTSVVCWVVGIVCVMMFDFLRQAEKGSAMSMTIEKSLDHFIRRRFLALLTGIIALSLMPLPEKFLLGNRGQLLLSMIVPILMITSTGLVCCSVALLFILMWPFKYFSKRTSRDQSHREALTARTVVSMALILVAVFLFIPWQVAFLGCWGIHFITCATSSRPRTKTIEERLSATTAVPLTDFHAERTGTGTSDSPRDAMSVEADFNFNIHLLLFMTWLLPLAAPVLVVWTRTLATAGLTTPFDGDHFVLNVAPFLILVDYTSRTTSTTLLMRTRFEKFISIRWCLLAVGAVAFVLGSRKVYMVFDAARLSFGIFGLVRIGPRYWRGMPNKS